MHRVDTVTGTLANARSCFAHVILFVNTTKLIFTSDAGDGKKHGDVIFLLLHTQPFNSLMSGTTRVSRYQKGTGSSAIAEKPRDASCQLKSCQLPLNSAVQQVLNKSVIQLEG